MDPRPGLSEFIKMARALGYDGVGLRKWQGTAETTNDEIAAIKRSLNKTGLRVCSITTGLDSVQALLPPARELDVKVLQAGGSPENMDKAARLLDNDMRLGPQIHTGGAFETVAATVEMFKGIADPGVGVIVDPANYLLAGEKWGASFLAPISGRIIGCNFQSVVVGSGDASLSLRDGTQVVYRRADAAENTQADFPRFFAALNAAGYDGFVNVIEPAEAGQSIEELAGSTVEYLRGIIPG